MPNGHGRQEISAKGASNEKEETVKEGQVMKAKIPKQCPDGTPVGGRSLFSRAFQTGKPLCHTHKAHDIDAKGYTIGETNQGDI